MIEKVILTSLIVFNSFQALYSQKRPDFRKIDFEMGRMADPPSLEAEEIADYINKNYTREADKAYAIFSWITDNIQYDIENMFNIDFYQNQDGMVDYALRTRKGICLHFASVFNKIAIRTNIKSFVVLGYTKQRGIREYMPHSWCACLIDSQWYLFDPTWGSGYYHNDNFYKERNMSQFMVRPERFIRSHMPFDPLFQFLNYPVSNKEFYNHEVGLNETKPFFNYSDSLNNYEQLSDLKKIESTIRRIKQNGINSALIYHEIKYLREKAQSTKYNVAVSIYNSGISDLNECIVLWNEFNPSKNVSRMTTLLDSAEYSLTVSQLRLSEIENPVELLNSSIVQLLLSIKTAEKSINDQRSAIERYMNSRK
ncbi:MAG TPA: transglutaminase-like domain-containing protein [Bacteroidales bacterium]|nr:transglutaminase-like domain-containing protein [Bacteroidales bacterium]